MPATGNNREKKATRALAAELGVRYTTALRLLREKRAACDDPTTAWATLAEQVIAEQTPAAARAEQEQQP